MEANSFDQSDVFRAEALSNGRLTVVVGAAGGGFCTLDALPLMRWSAEQGGASGAFVRVTDAATGEGWAAGLAPEAPPPDEYGAELGSGHLRLRRRDGSLVTKVEACVSPFDDVAVVRVSLANGGTSDRRLRTSTHLELAGGAHRNWSSLVPRSGSAALLVERGPQGEDDDPVYLFHLVRGGSRGPAAGAMGGGGAGRALGLSREVVVRAGESAELLALAGAAASREDAESLIRRYSAGATAANAFPAAAERVRNLLADLRIPQGWSRRIPSLTGALVFGVSDAPAASPWRGAEAADRALAVLRELGLDGALPLVLAESGERESTAAAVALGTYWRRQGLAVDVLLLLPDEPTAESWREPTRTRRGGPLGRTVAAVAEDVPEEVRAFARATARLTFDPALVAAAAD